jgi:hypothetical protein
MLVAATFPGTARDLLSKSGTPVLAYGARGCAPVRTIFEMLGIS